MSGHRRAAAASVLGVIVVVLVAWGAAAAGAQGRSSVPTVTVDRDEFAPGEEVIVTIGGFAARNVTVALCGNQARRGSSDCNTSESMGRTLRVDSTVTMAPFRASAPPVPCPCVIRVSSAGNEEVAVAPITLVGHPVAPVVGGTAASVSLSITVNKATEGVMGGFRSSVAGATPYEVTIRVRNQSTEALEGVRVSGWAGRGGDDVIAPLDLPRPGALRGGEVWEHVATVELPWPVHGTVEWRAEVSGAGPTVVATDATRNVPLLLWILGVILATDLVVLGVRLVMRMRRRARDLEEPDGASASAPEVPELVRPDDVQRWAT